MYNIFYSNLSEFAENLDGMIDEGMHKTSIQNMHKIGWNSNYLKYADVSMLGHGCGVSHFPQFYDNIKKKYQILPCPYVGKYLVEKTHKYLQKTWIIELAKSVELFVLVSKSDIPTNKY